MGMDKNYNQAVIRKLLKHNQEKNRIRNFFVCVTIGCAASLIFAFILYLFGTQEQKLRSLKNRSQVSYENITISQAEQCKLDKRISWIGLEVFVGRGKVGEIRLTISWQDEAFMELDQINYIGMFPTGYNEIMIPQQYLDKIGKSQTKLGDIISLNLGDNITREYKIAAILTNNSKAERSQHVYVSLACAMMLKGILEEDDIRVNANVNMKNAIEFNKEEARKQAENIAEVAGISEEQIKFDDSYYIQAGLSRLTIEDIITLILVILLILTASYFVIHSIFYISVAAKVREYGQMRTIGMTKSQVKSLILQEGLYLLIKGSIPGLIVGGCVGYILVPNGFDVLNTVFAVVLCILLLTLFVGISVRIPGKIAADASPIEASIYTGYTKENRKQKYNKRQLTPKYLASLNLKRNGKKTIWTMCSLILAGILIGTIASYLMSYDPAASVTYSFPEGEYQLTLNASMGFGGDTSLDGQMKLYSLLQADGVMGEELLSELKSLNYITDVKPWRYLTASTTLFSEDNTQIGLNGISESDFKILKEMSYQGLDSYQELLKHPGLIVVNEYHSYLQKNPLKIGDNVPIIFYDGKGQHRKVYLPVIAVVKINSWRQKNRTAKLPLSIIGSSFMMPNNIMDKWAGMNTTYGYEISVEQKNEKAAGIILEEMYGMEEDLYIASKSENREYYEKQFFSRKIICYTLAAFLIIFGIINLINTIITNLYSRKKEFRILQAVGLTEEQLKDMLNIETLYYTGISSICTLIFGSILGYAFVMTEIQMGVDMIYSYPWLPILLYILIMFIVQKSLTSYGIRLLQQMCGKPTPLGMGWKTQ